MNKYVQSIKLFIDNALNNHRVEYRINVIEEILRLYAKQEIKPAFTTYEEYKAMADLMKIVKRRIMYDVNKHKKEERD